jgi:hypothetical protein
MTLEPICRRCHRPFAVKRYSPNRIVCPDCMVTERERTDCPGCNTERGTSLSGRPRLLCPSCAHDRDCESSRRNHHDARLRHRAAPENPPEPAVIDATLEDQRTATLRLGQAALAGQERAREIASAKAALAERIANGDAYVGGGSHAA